MRSSRSNQTWLHIFQCFSAANDTDRRDDQLVFRPAARAADHKAAVKRMSESTCSASSTSDWTASAAVHSESVEAGHTQPEARRSLQQQHAASPGSGAESPCSMQASIHDSQSPCRSPCTDRSAALMDSEQDVHASSDTAATTESLIRGAVPAAASSSPTTANTAQTSTSYVHAAEDLEFRQPSHRSHPQHAKQPACFPGLSVLHAGLYSHEELETGPLLDHEAGLAVHQLLLSSEPLIPTAAPTQGAQAMQLAKQLLERRASHEGATTITSPAPAAPAGGPTASSPCAAHAPHQAAGIYSALVAERRAKVAAAAAALPNNLPVPEASIQAASPAAAAWSFPAAVPAQLSPWPPAYSPSATHHLCQPISTRLSSTATASAPHRAGSPTSLGTCNPASPLSGIPEADSSAFLSALQEPSNRASAPAGLLAAAALKTASATAAAAASTGPRQPGSSWQEAAYQLPQQQAAGSKRLTHHHLHPVPPQLAAGSGGLQQLPVRFLPACAPAAPSRLGLQTWQQPQEQAACTPQLASRVEALRLKLRAQAVELQVIAEQQQGRRQAHAAAAAGAAHSGGARGPASRRAVARGATFAFPSASPGVGASLARGPELLTPVSSLRCCRTMEVEEESQGEAEEERSRHESTMSYLRMLSRSNTSFCTRLRRSNTQSRSLHDFSPQGMSTCSSMGTRRSILGGMEDE